ncbi:Kinesin-like protein KIN-14N [Cucurbita argyrosperma subsp. argyrosperma]|nr:Kinesin-like protein KIN-14N [Cucurbita argyrosperma subsp. argyrosperma]
MVFLYSKVIHELALMILHSLEYRSTSTRHFELNRSCREASVFPRSGVNWRSTRENPSHKSKVIVFKRCYICFGEEERTRSISKHRSLPIFFSHVWAEIRRVEFVNISPDSSSPSESLCSASLRCPVNACEIGTPRRLTNTQS